MEAAALRTKSHLGHRDSAGSIFMKPVKAGRAHGVYTPQNKTTLAYVLERSSLSLELKLHLAYRLARSLGRLKDATKAPVAR